MDVTHCSITRAWEFWLLHVVWDHDGHIHVVGGNLVPSCTDRMNSWGSMCTLHCSREKKNILEEFWNSIVHRVVCLSQPSLLREGDYISPWVKIPVAKMTLKQIPSLLHCTFICFTNFTLDCCDLCLYSLHENIHLMLLNFLFCGFFVCYVFCFRTIST